MKLRTRITLSVSFCFATVASGLMLEGQFREWGAEHRYQEVLLTGYQNTWNGIAGAELQRLVAMIPSVTRNEDALRALVRRNQADYAQSLVELLINLQASSPPIAFETAILNGTLFFSNDHHPWSATKSDRPADPATLHVLSPRLIDAALRAGKPLLGLVPLSDQEGYGLAAVFPQLDRTGPTAVSALYLRIDHLLPAFATSVGAPAFFQYLDGSLGQGTDPDLWQRLDTTLALHRHRQVHTEHYGKQVYTIAGLLLQDLFGRGAAILLTVEDITTAYWRDILLNVLSHGGVVVALALFLSGLYWSLRQAFRPLNQVIGILNALARGDTRMPTLRANPADDDEIGRLANTVEQFHQAQVARSQLVKLRQELHIAARIQRSLLPASFPERPEFDLCAALYPFGEVGGDFYDFFDLPDGRLGLVIADVSDKGVAAALFMAVARTVIHAVAQIVPDPGPCLEQANTLLSEDNAAAMFVTVCYGTLEPVSGEFRYANAGHNPLYHIAVDRTVTALPLTGGMALGIIDDLPFAEQRLVLHPGEQLLFYTDGVTEAVDLQNREFTTRRLEATLTLAPTDVSALIATVTDAVQTFAAGAPPADDLTLMALAYWGQSQMAGSDLRIDDSVSIPV
ncbi:MAG: SpoIIE family protein phosphatase [Gammaproteobacteria bacterium]|nr:SpoIIE family protein phosphatase [Gammaproteobacteria bacterium]MCP5195426.1 SpoIIE family protein phosphatase [Gammaproteobacteria bacterium]